MVGNGISKYEPMAPCMSKRGERSGRDPEAKNPSSHTDTDTRVLATRRASPQDLLLVERLLKGDEEAFRGLVDAYHGSLLRLARIFLPSNAVAEEVVQETWMAVLEGLGSFEGRSSLKSWIFRILTNRAKTRAVREGRSLPFSTLTNPGENEPAVDPSRFEANGAWAEPPREWEANTPEKLLMQHEALRRLQQAIMELPPNQRAVVTLRDVEGLDAAEVCNILEISETNQRVLLHRARSKLRRALEEYLDQM